MASSLRAFKRLGGLLGLLWQGWRMTRQGFAQLPPAQQQRQVEQWAQAFLAQAGVQLRREGEPVADGPVLLVANHQSWLDIPTLHALRACRFVSKAEVARWPVVGALAQAAGTLFVDRRSRRATVHTAQAMAQALRAGDVLAVFPEGTVSDGHSLLPFHGNMLQAAIDADVPVQAVAMSFVDARTGAPSYVPSEAYLDEPIWRSLWRTLASEEGLVAVVRCAPPHMAQGRDRRRWAQDLQQQVHSLQQASYAAAVVQ